MIKGINSAFGYGIPLEERLALIKDTGFEIISLDFEKDIEHIEGSWESQVKLAEKYGLTVESAHLTGVNMTSVWSDCEDAEFVSRRLIDELKHMSEVGVPVGVAHVTWGLDRPPAPNRNALDRYLRAAEAAEKYNVKLALENSVFPEHVHYLLENIKSDHVGFCYDSGHENYFTPQENYLERYGDRLLTMHLHDNMGNYDQHDFPFNGTINWKEKVALIRKTAIGDRLILEMGYQKEENAQSLVKKAYAALEKLEKL